MRGQSDALRSRVKHLNGVGGRALDDKPSSKIVEANITPPCGGRGLAVPIKTAPCKGLIPPHSEPLGVS